MHYSLLEPDLNYAVSNHIDNSLLGKWFPFFWIYNDGRSGTSGEPNDISRDSSS